MDSANLESDDLAHQNRTRHEKLLRQEEGLKVVGEVTGWPLYCDDALDFENKTPSHSSTHEKSEAPWIRILEKENIVEADWADPADEQKE